MLCLYFLEPKNCTNRHYSCNSRNFHDAYTTFFVALYHTHVHTHTRTRTYTHTHQASRRGGARPAEAPRLRPADVAFADDHTPFLAVGYGARPQGWDMWDPAGGTRPRQLRGDSSNVAATTDNSSSGYVVMFDYGSVVFLHFTQQQQEVSRQKGCVVFWLAFAVLG